MVSPLSSEHVDVSMADCIVNLDPVATAAEDLCVIGPFSFCVTKLQGLSLLTFTQLLMMGLLVIPDPIVSFFVRLDRRPAIGI